MDILVKPSNLFGEIRAISSKSDVHRLLIASALAKGKSRVLFTTLSDDISATVSVLSAMGAKIDISGNDGGYIATICGIEKMPDDVILDANECGTAARLILPIAAALSNGFTVTGKNGLLKRPFGDLVKCMEENGTKCTSDLLPITANGKLKSGIFTIRGDVSSQYVSGLLFALPLLDGDSQIVIDGKLSSEGYIYMTLRVLCAFGIAFSRTGNGFLIKGNQKYVSKGEYTAEGDWSNAAFWICGGAMGGDITVKGLDINSLQPDSRIFGILKSAGARITCGKNGEINVKKSILHGVKIHGDAFPDIVPILATMFSVTEESVFITNVERLKIKESDRVKSTAAMLNALGADIKVDDSGFNIYGVDRLIGGTVDSANDHRIAMCAAIASSRCVGDILIRGAECVNKSYPTFFEDFEKLGGKYSVING